ncbi:NAD(P)-dependent oxidoreductase [Plantibacter sp. H53]|uniref:SDR family oxidoreductase n=1 Tax=Plantibacter sp. H53 TaxID=1827323 RepID=UPI0007DA2F2F|nr:SDR family oxidoreductase [Plantibacter sp. H53]OAN35332.1 NAD(P)-dependent oxidoreductase [Plantibacter sp. H53]
MSLVVTGATGHLGHLVVEHLLTRGTDPATIVATGRRTEALADLATQGVRTAKVDFTDPATLDAVLEAGDTLLLVSGSEVGQRVAQHAAVIDAAKRAGVARLVYTSALRADTSPLILAPEHKATEELIHASGLPFTILRNGWYTENYGQSVDQAKATGSFVGSVGDGLVSSASRTDYAEAAAVVLTTDGHEGKAYELAGDVAWSHPELAQAIGEVVGREVVYQDLSPEDHLKALLAAGLDEGTAGFVVALDGNTRDGLLAETSGDLGRLIGHPTTPLVEGLRTLVA